MTDHYGTALEAQAIVREQSISGEAPIYSSCRIHGRANIYTFWTNDTDLMVKVRVCMNWPPTNGRRVQSVETRRDRGDEPWVQADAPEHMLASLPARGVATHLIRRDRTD